MKIPDHQSHFPQNSAGFTFSTAQTLSSPLLAPLSSPSHHIAEKGSHPKSVPLFSLFLATQFSLIHTDSLISSVVAAAAVVALSSPSSVAVVSRWPSQPTLFVALRRLVEPLGSFRSLLVFASLQGGGSSPFPVLTNRS